MSIALAAQQQALVAALHGRESTIDAGVLTYRRNAQALAERALQAAYPTVASLMGPDNFAHLARELWHREPPVVGDVARWGGGLAALVESVPDIAASEPYVADVARVEWLVHRAAFAADARQDLTSLALLTHGDPSQATLLLAPGSACVVSRFPVATIVQAHVEGTPALEEAALRLRGGVAEACVVWRDGLRPRVRVALEGEPDFISALQERRSLADSLQAVPALDFAAWLSVAAQSGLLLRAGMR